jgi:hypothetical protein
MKNNNETGQITLNSGGGVYQQKQPKGYHRDECI